MCQADDRLVGEVAAAGPVVEDVVPVDVRQVKDATEAEVLWPLAASVASWTASPQQAQHPLPQGLPTGGLFCKRGAPPGFMPNFDF